MGKEKPKSGLKSRFLIRAFAVLWQAPSARERHLGEGAGDDAGMRRTEAAGANQGAFKVPRHAAARGCGLWKRRNCLRMNGNMRRNREGRMTGRVRAGAVCSRKNEQSGTGGGVRCFGCLRPGVSVKRKAQPLRTDSFSHRFTERVAQPKHRNTGSSSNPTKTIHIQSV
jgi:hypothetical protein